ncbi:hypothetical protein [Desulfonatronum thiosulfatophilum]|uniref:hypothetical protein n=1 Tax=Desulfonatronum thiosulfatophilum TaxID=617002 RepID=UPI00137AA04F|nr:hypothetical protein [Desulfonatronum thiosulfatophilum]
MLTKTLKGCAPAGDMLIKSRKKRILQKNIRRVGGVLKFLRLRIFTTISSKVDVCLEENNWNDKRVKDEKLCFQ